MKATEDVGRLDSGLSEGLGPEAESLGWHALNYRTANIIHAEAMWQELAACVERRTAAAVFAERAKMLPLLELMQEVFSIAAHGCTPDGHHVNDHTGLWAESWQRRISGPNV